MNIITVTSENLDQEHIKGLSSRTLQNRITN